MSENEESLPKHLKQAPMEKHNYLLNPFYTDRLFQCYMLDESICHFRGVKSILLL